MLDQLRRWTLWATIAIATLLVIVFAVRAFDAHRGEPLQLWHTYVPTELSRGEMDRTDLAGYMAAEDRLFAAVRENVTDQLPDDARRPFNRYFAGSPVYPGGFAHDYNRSFVLTPEGEVKGAVVLLHGLTDSPYSLRHVAERYVEHGFIAISIRLPGHGTVPGALTRIDYPDWLAAARLAMREARRRAGPDRPVDIVGYSNGGAVALMHALDALDDPALVVPSRIVLLSPMVGVTEFARFAGLAALPAVFPAFAKAAWLSIIPEFNPFKYNSFPVHAARESFKLTRTLQSNITRHLRNDRLSGLAPVLTFQSVLDHTVSTRAVIDALHRHLDANGSELVLFDINRGSHFDTLLSARSDTAIARLLPPAPRPFRTAIVTTRAPGTIETEARVTAAGATEETAIALSTPYPADVYSLSHIAIPFPLEDGLYGLTPDPAENFGVRLGNIAARGETGALMVSPQMLVRMSSNPFTPYLLDRISAGLPPR